MAHRLANEPSAYLRQHAHQPVDWYPWGPEALADAAAREVPLLISIGYSSCHWCHVMAHESFDDPAIAAVMNERFVCIKVDREERPDVDALYMDVVQALTGRGGWPLTVFATPDGSPFFGGTYYRPEQFTQLLDAVHRVWHEQRGDVDQNVEALVEALGRTARVSPPSELPDLTIVEAARQAQANAFDRVWGGFGPPPKFPSVGNLLLVARFAGAGDKAALTMLNTTLAAMASGGMYDHLAGGFARYSTDERWLVPHFEKMLYDQALMLRAYTAGFQITGRPLYTQVVGETIAYLAADMQLPGGGFAAAEDADSPAPDGHMKEGHFTTWTPAEVHEVLADDVSLADEAIAWWGISAAGNFEGRSIPNRLAVRGGLARSARLEHARLRLLAARNQRPRPLRDDKVVLEWNALLVGALAEAAMAWQRPDWVDLAESTAVWLVDHLRRPDGRWHRTWHGGVTPSARHDALAVDHAALVDAFIRVYEATGSARWLHEATVTAELLLTHFWDRDRGGLFTTPNDGDTLVVRQKELTDGATPGASSLAAVAFSRLAALTGDERLRRCAEVLVGMVHQVAATTPLAAAVAVDALALLHAGPVEVVIPGRQRPDLVAVVQQRWRPDMVLSWGDPIDSPLWEGRSDSCAYVCRRYTCEAPSATMEELLAALGRAGA
jgi:uncharacterized protein YyaL (SSP411 family)